MPTYTFVNTETDELFECNISIQDKEDYLLTNKNIKQVFTKAPTLVGSLHDNYNYPRLTQTTEDTTFAKTHASVLRKTPLCKTAHKENIESKKRQLKVEKFKNSFNNREF